MKCRHCGAELSLTLVDLGTAPPSNAYLTEEQLHQPEKWYPLRVQVCTECWLVQTEDFVGADEMFSGEYAYFSSYSSSWLEHARTYVRQMIERFSLDSSHCVIELAANDGYLLQYFKEAGIPCYGIEPTHSTAVAARKKGLEIIEEFFGLEKAKELAAKGRRADLIVANNVLAHVPDINDFVAGIAHLLMPDGFCTIEFPHLKNLVEKSQFDTIYHEHFSYLSLHVVEKILFKQGLNVFDVEELPTHGGSLRIYAQLNGTATRRRTDRARKLYQEEDLCGIETSEFYVSFSEKARKIKMDFLSFLLHAAKEKKSVAGYGAAAKGNTLINYCGIRGDLVGCVADKNPNKQGKFLPGSRIEIVGIQEIKESKPDYIVVFPWNLIEEILDELTCINEWEAKFVTVVPALRVWA